MLEKGQKDLSLGSLSEEWEKTLTSSPAGYWA